VTKEDDDYIDGPRMGTRIEVFCPAFCPLKNMHAVNPNMDLDCINCGRDFLVGGRERVPHNCGYDPRNP
jgi:hypothetical protein